MARIKNPFISLGAHGSIGKAVTFVRRRGQEIAERFPIPKDLGSIEQLSWRTMYQKCALLWHDLSIDEKNDCKRLGRPLHMTGFAYWQSKCLKPNPGIYLPLAGGIMQGIISMNGFNISDVLDPVDPQDADTEAARDAAIAAAIGGSLDCDIHGWDGSAWRNLLTESAAQHNLRVKLYDGANGIDSAILSFASCDVSALRGLFTRTQMMLQISGTHINPWYSALLVADATGGTAVGTVALWAWNGASYDRLRMENASLHNLRVRLYDGANGIDSGILSLAGSDVSAVRGLYTRSQIMLQYSVTSITPWYSAVFLGDATGGTPLGTVALWGYNGATYDRLRTWSAGTLKIGRAGIDSTTIRKIATGAVVAGAHELYWIACSPDSPSAEWELTDAIAGGATVVYDHFDNDKHSEHLNFDPPMKFASGIWIEKFDHMKSLVFCYV